MYSQYRLSQLSPKEGEFYRVAGVEKAGWPYSFNAGDLVGFYDVFGYSSPLYYKMMEFRSRNDYCGKYYDLMNVKYFVTFPNSDDRMTDCDGKIKPPIEFTEIDHIDYTKLPMNKTDSVKAYENTGILGYAWAVNQVVNADDKDQITTISKNIDIHNQALVNKKNYYEIKQSLSDSSQPVKYETELLSYTPNEIDLNVTSNQKALLVTSDIYYPGWKVTINGKEQKLYEVNDLLRGTIVSQGKNIIQYKFHPDSFFAGIKLALIAILISLLYLLIICFVRDKKKLQVVNIIYCLILLCLFGYLIYLLPGLQNVTIKRTI
jgi:hypothetical protein